MGTPSMDDEHGVDLLRRLNPGRAVPVHYDDYGVFRSPLSDFEDRCRHEGLGNLVRPVRRGETVSLDDQAWRVGGGESSGHDTPDSGRSTAP